MKLIFLSVIVFIYGYFCDISRAICQKMAESRVKNGNMLTGKTLVFMSNFASSNLIKWEKIEKKFIAQSIVKRNF